MLAAVQGRRASLSAGRGRRRDSSRSPPGSAAGAAPRHRAELRRTKRRECGSRRVRRLEGVRPGACLERSGPRLLEHAQSGAGEGRECVSGTRGDGEWLNTAMTIEDHGAQRGAACRRSARDGGPAAADAIRPTGSRSTWSERSGLDRAHGATPGRPRPGTPRGPRVGSGKGSCSDSRRAREGGSSVVGHDEAATLKPRPRSARVRGSGDETLGICAPSPRGAEKIARRWPRPDRHRGGPVDRPGHRRGRSPASGSAWPRRSPACWPRTSTPPGGPARRSTRPRSTATWSPTRSGGDLSRSSADRERACPFGRRWRPGESDADLDRSRGARGRRRGRRRSSAAESRDGRVVLPGVERRGEYPPRRRGVEAARACFGGEHRPRRRGARTLAALGHADIAVGRRSRGGRVPRPETGWWRPATAVEPGQIHNSNAYSMGGSGAARGRASERARNCAGRPSPPSRR